MKHSRRHASSAGAGSLAENGDLNMRKVYLLQPWYKDKCKIYNFSLAYIKFHLLDHGYDAEIIDCSHYDRELNQVMAMIKNGGGGEDPIVGITGYSKERFNAYELIRKVRKEFPKSIIVTGGRHFGYLAKETLQEMPEVDMVVKGEGEVAMREVCDAIHNGNNFGGILGLTFRNKNNEIVENTERPLEKNLDKFRMWDIDHIPNPKQFPLTHPTKLDNDRYFIVFATRGCPFKCTFCSLTATSPRYRSVDLVIKEIEEKIKITGARGVRFGDSALTVSKKWIREFCNKVIEKDLKIKWACYSRVDIDLELLTLMRRAGFASAEVALESGSQKVLNAIKKSINLEEFENFCKEAYRLGIKVWVFTIISSPEETIEDVDMTLNLIRKVRKYIYAAGMQSTRLLPDATLIHEAREKGIIPKDFNWFKPYTNKGTGIARDDFETLPLYIEKLTPRQINEKLDEFFKITDRNLSNFDYLKRAIRLNLKPRNLKKFFTTRGKLIRASRRAFLMFVTAIKNFRRDEHYELGF